MLGWILSHLNWLLIGAFPWWLWIVAGALGAVAALLLIPIRSLAEGFAVAALIVGVAISFKSWGYQQGVAFERTRWEAEVATEQRRLADAFVKTMDEEIQRAADAARQATETQKDADNAIHEAEKLEAPGIVVPESVATSLCEIAGGCRDSKTGHSKRP